MMDSRQTAKIAAPISGDKLYQERARAAFPLLVRQAEAGQAIYYSDLAEELGMPNPRNLNYVLGSIGQTVENLSKAWGEKIPPIQCAVISKTTGLPGEGIGWFLIKEEEFSRLPRSKKREIVKAELTRVFAFRRWPEVLKAVDLVQPSSDFTAVNKAAAKYGLGGESPEHLRLKNYVAANPSVVLLPPATPKGETEVGLPSGDCLDVSFHTLGEWVAVEVKSKLSPEADIVRGLYQWVKYEAIMRAVEASEDKERTGRAVLVLEREFPRDLLALKNILGVEVIDRVRVAGCARGRRALTGGPCPKRTWRPVGFRGSSEVDTKNKPWSPYKQVVVETYAGRKPGKSSLIHVRPVNGQPFPTTMDVECSRSMRERCPIGTKFCIYAKEADRQGGKPFLYSHFDWPYEVVDA